MPMTISINPTMEEKLSRVATLTNSDVETVLEELIADRLDEKLDRLAAIQEALDDFEAGRTFTHEEAREMSLEAIRRGKAKREAKEAANKA